MVSEALVLRSQKICLGGDKMIEHYSVPKELGESHLAYKVCAIEAEGKTIVRILEDVPIHGGKEIGWDIQVENGVEPYKSIITNKKVTEM